MAWTDGVTRAVGYLITAANWNDLLGAAGSLMQLKSHTHGGTTGEGSQSLGPLVLEDFTDAAAAAAPGAGKTRIYATGGRLRQRAGAAGSDNLILIDGEGGGYYNFLTNPGFEIWQRGAGAFTADGVYTADRWLMDEAGTDALSVTREGTTKKDDSLYSLAAAFTLGSGAGATQIYQQLSINANDDNHQLRGRVVSARIAVRTATASAARVFIATDGTGGTTSYSGYHTGGATFENLDVINITVPTDATYVRIGVAFAASATVYMDDATLAISVTASLYAGLSRAEEWGRCQRYYQSLGGLVAANPRYTGNAPSALGLEAMWQFATKMAVTPTTTKNGTWTVTNSAQPTISTADVNGARVLWDAAAAGMAYVHSDSADDTLVAEANP